MKELILYIASYCQKTDRTGHLGATKLNKILFYSDFATFLQLGKPITGQEYFALEWGPAPRRSVPLREELESSKAIQIVNAAMGGDYVQQIIFPQREPDLSHFSAQEISIVDQMILRFIFKEARESSNESHQFIGWESAELQETIPYSSAYLDANHILGMDPSENFPKSAIEYARKLESKAAEALGKYA